MKPAQAVACPIRPSPKIGDSSSINGLPASERLRVRQEQSARLLADLKAWLGEERSRLSRPASVAKPIDDLLKRAPPSNVIQ